jgi:Family of unknown function (DUF5329)
MKAHWYRRALILVLLLAPSARAAPAPQVVHEIDYLLSVIDHSGCEFKRNGRWYGVAIAAAHLRYKYEILAASNRIHATEEFIEKAATQSSLSGKLYEVRCPGSAPVASQQWLRAALMRYRLAETGGPGTPPAARGASGIDHSISNQKTNRPARF